MDDLDMKPENLDVINRSFETQAEGFESKSLQFTKEEYLKFTVDAVCPSGSDDFLEVAAGTCVCGRSFAPFVRSVVCLDATEAMLQVGKREALNQGLSNIEFVKGYAEDLPFASESFDIVFSRLAFHHLTDTGKAFSEMERCLKTKGKLVLIDMEAARDDLRKTQDEIERLRDPSHVMNLSKEEMQDLFISQGLTIKLCETTRIQQKLNSWMMLTKIPDQTRSYIIDRMKSELTGGVETGFMPYEENGAICFDQRWVLTVGIKG